MEHVKYALANKIPKVVILSLPKYPQTCHTELAEVSPTK